MRWDWIDHSATPDVDLPAQPPPRPQPPSPQKAARILGEAWKHPELGPLVWVAMATGARRGELIFRVGTVRFDPATGGPRRQTVTVVFGSTVVRGEAALKGFDVQFNSGEHPVLHEEVHVAGVTIQGPTVQVPVDLAFRDNSSFFDDPYSATVDVLVVAEVRLLQALRFPSATDANGL